MSCNKTKGRTANGLGSIRKRKRKRKDGSIYEYWEGKITLYYDSGTKEQVTRSFTAATQAEVIEKMKSLGYQVNEEEPNTSLSLKSWLDVWQSEYLGNVKPSTAYLSLMKS